MAITNISLSIRCGSRRPLSVSWNTHPAIAFERYADDVICHCRSEKEARRLLEVLQERFASCGLQLHPQKTQIVYCRDGMRRAPYPVIQFTFLGYAFRPRMARSA